jgi:hypothetical protein
LEDPVTPTPKPKVRLRETTAAGKIGEWQRLLAPLDANAEELKHLEVPRTRLAAMAAHATALKQQQAAQRAAKQEASKQLLEMLNEGGRLTTLLRQALKQHYGIRSEKLAEFGLQPFRGRKQPEPSTPTPATPGTSPGPEAASHPDPTISR